MPRWRARRHRDFEDAPISELDVHYRPGPGAPERLHRRQWHGLLGDRLYGRYGLPGVGYRRYWCSIDRHRHPGIRLCLLLLHQAGYTPLTAAFCALTATHKSLPGQPCGARELELDPHPSVLPAAATRLVLLKYYYSRTH